MNTSEFSLLCYVLIIYFPVLCHILNSSVAVTFFFKFPFVGRIKVNLILSLGILGHPHSKRVSGLSPGWGLSVWSLHVLPEHECVHSGFLPPFKNTNVKLVGDFKMTLGVSASVDGCPCLTL